MTTQEVSLPLPGGADFKVDPFIFLLPPLPLVSAVAAAAAADDAAATKSPAEQCARREQRHVSTGIPVSTITSAMMIHAIKLRPSTKMRSEETVRSMKRRRRQREDHDIEYSPSHEDIKESQELEESDEYELRPKRQRRGTAGGGASNGADVTVMMNRGDVRLSLFDALRELQSKVDDGTVVCPARAIGQLLTRLAKFRFTRWSRTLSEYQLSLPTVLVARTSSSSSTSSSTSSSSLSASSKFETVRFELMPQKHASHTVFIQVSVGENETISFTMKINATGLHRSKNSLYIAANEYTFFPSDVDVTQLNPTTANNHVSVTLSQYQPTTTTAANYAAVSLLCAVGGEVRHANISPTDDETSKKPTRVVWGEEGEVRVVGCHKRSESGRPLKCNIIALAGHRIRFDIRRTKNLNPDKPIWASTKLKLHSDSRVIAPNNSFSFQPIH
jgi:hypothetical protein